MPPNSNPLWGGRKRKKTNARTVSWITEATKSYSILACMLQKLKEKDNQKEEKNVFKDIYIIPPRKEEWFSILCKRHASTSEGLDKVTHKNNGSGKVRAAGHRTHTNTVPTVNGWTRGKQWLFNFFLFIWQTNSVGKNVWRNKNGINIKVWRFED